MGEPVPPPPHPADELDTQKQSEIVCLFAQTLSTCARIDYVELPNPRDHALGSGFSAFSAVHVEEQIAGRFLLGCPY